MIKAQYKNDVISIKDDGGKSVLTISVERNPEVPNLMTILEHMMAIQVEHEEPADKNPMQTYRERKGLTHEQLADIVGCSRQTIVKIEGKTSVPKLPLALKISDALGMDVRELV